MVGLFQPASQPERLYLPEVFHCLGNSGRDGGAFCNAPDKIFCLSDSPYGGRGGAAGAFGPGFGRFYRHRGGDYRAEPETEEPGICFQ